MRAYFAIGDAHTAKKLLGGRSVLFSFAYVGSRWLAPEPLAETLAAADGVMIDSGAFTAWKQGRPVALDVYMEWLATAAPRHDFALTLDVIGDAEASVRNWRRHREAKPPTVPVPVWHEGDPIEQLDEYVSGSPLVALGRIEGRRSEQKTLEFYDAAFNRHPDAKYHALGNSNPATLELYPFESFDSTGWQRDAAYSNAARWPFNRCSKELRMRAFIDATETICHRPAKQIGLFGRVAGAEGLGRIDRPAAPGKQG